MNVLTLTSQDQVDKYSSNNYKLLKEGNYDKVVFNGITNLIGHLGNFYYYAGGYGFLTYVPEIEIQNCTMTENTIYIGYVKENPLKITIKDSKIYGFSVEDVHTSISVVIDNVTIYNDDDNLYFTINNKESYTGNKSLISIKNCPNLAINSIYIDPDICDLEISNNSNIDAVHISIDAIPNEKAEQSKFLSQFTYLNTVVKLSKIDESNYQFEQADWDKLIPLLDAYPKLFKQINYDNFGGVRERYKILQNTIYIHIPSLTFPLCWADLEYKIDPLNNLATTEDFAWAFYINKNNGYNFTITHFDDAYSKDWYQWDELYGILVADNYEDIIYNITGQVFGGDSIECHTHIPIFLLSGKMVTSEITLIPNTYFRIRTIGSDMKIKSIKEVTRFHGKTIKVTGMEPFMILSVAGTRCLDIDGKVEIGQARTGSKVFLNGSITIKSLCMADINVDATIQQKTYTDIIGSVITNQIKSFIDGDITVPDIKKKIITGTVNVRSIVSATTIIGEITINQLDHIDYELDGLFQLVQTVSIDIIGDIEVKVCRIEILGFLEVTMEEA